MTLILKYIKNALVLFRFIPHILIFYCHPNKGLLSKELTVWARVIMNVDSNNRIFFNFCWLLRFVPEYRSVFYFRLGTTLRTLLSFLAKPRESFYLNMPSVNVGYGCVLQHGFSTIVEAISIGHECQIWHNVTIGTNISHSGNKPIIGNNVKVCTGAIVLGKIQIGNNVTIGAGTIIVKDVPDNCTVVGNPATIIKKDGVSVSIKL
jgi:serine O-acetyltransferase